MANTTLRNIRVPDDLWGAVLRLSDEAGTNASEVVRGLLTQWVADQTTISAESS